ATALAGRLDDRGTGRELSSAFVHRPPERPAAAGAIARRERRRRATDLLRPQVPQPGSHRGGDVPVLGAQGSRTLESVRAGVREPFEQIAQVALPEDRVARTPQDE